MNKLEENKGISLETADELSKLMDVVTDNEANPFDRARAFFNLVDIKQCLASDERWEEMSDFKKLEELNECYINFYWKGNLIECGPQ